MSNPLQLERLVDSVQLLNDKLHAYYRELAQLNERFRAFERAQRRHRIALVLTIIGLALDLALSGLFIFQHIQQNCFNTRSANFFNAEQMKVNGQISGEKRQLTGVQEILKGTRASSIKGLNDFEAGTQIWISRSEKYLNTIGKLIQNNHC